MPRRPARPVSWVYSPGVSSACASPLNLTSRSSTTVRAGMLMPSARVSVANTALHQAADEQLLDGLLERRQQPGVVRGDPPLQRLAPLPVAQHAQVGLRQVAGARARRPGGSRRPRPSVVSRSPARTHWATAASQPARLKMKVIAGSSPSRSSRSSTVIRDGGRKPTRRRRRPRRGCGRARSQTAVADCRSSSRVARTSSGSTCSSPSRPGVQREQVEQPVADHHVLPQRHRPVLVDDDRRCRRARSTSQSPNSSALLTVADRLTSATCSGSWRITSSHTAPRNRSAR